MVPQNLSCILAVIALVITIWHGATGKPLLWVAVLLMCIAMLLGCYPR
jgi:hypothetical protein